MCCKKCGKFMGVLVLLFGVAFLLQDLNIFGFWGISWYAVGFLLAGFCLLGSSCCADCQGGCGGCSTSASACCETKPSEMKMEAAAPVKAEAPAKKKQ